MNKIVFGSISLLASVITVFVFITGNNLPEWLYTSNQEPVLSEVYSPVHHLPSPQHDIIESNQYAIENTTVPDVENIETIITEDNPYADMSSKEIAKLFLGEPINVNGLATKNKSYEIWSYDNNVKIIFEDEMFSMIMY